MPEFGRPSSCPVSIFSFAEEFAKVRAQSWFAERRTARNADGMNLPVFRRFFISNPGRKFRVNFPNVL